MGYYTEQNPLTLAKLALISNNDLIAYGEYANFRWAAVKGGIEDWAIYIAPNTWSLNDVKTNGYKVFSEDHIRDLVPCDDDTLIAYRF